jgi:nucleoside-diphosphate-sugar epimerase
MKALVVATSRRHSTFERPWPQSNMGFNPVFSAILAGNAPVQFDDRPRALGFTSVAGAATGTSGAAVRGVPGRVYNIGGGSLVSLRAFDLIACVSGRKVTIDEQRPLKGDRRDTYAGTTKARIDLASATPVTLEEGLRAMWRWMEATKA